MTMGYAYRVVKPQGPVPSPATLVLPPMPKPTAPCYCLHCRANPPRYKLCEQLREARIARMEIMLKHKGPIVEEPPCRV